MPPVVEAGKIIYSSLVQQLAFIPLFLTEVTDHDKHAYILSVTVLGGDKRQAITDLSRTGNINFELPFNLLVVIHRHFPVLLQQHEDIFAHP
ncbi:hypothetical protein D3C85_1675070 [compost metagenome]